MSLDNEMDTALEEIKVVLLKAETLISLKYEKSL